MADKILGEHTSHRSRKVLLLIDVISDFEFDDGECLFENALPAAQKIAALEKRARRAEVAVIYINNNFGNWREDFWETVKNF